jgi:hypothetical protein
VTVAHAALIAASATTASPAGQAPGRVCPLRYRYGPTAIARAETRLADTLYVVGGLYGNLPALNAIEMMARNDHPVGARPPVLCFNGDFNWFNVDDRAFAEINLRVLANDAILGNVEAELDAPADDAGCGCAYPDSVDAGVVERSNRIHARLKATAGRHADLLDRIARLPIVARYRVADCRIGVVHGDAESLAGWRFDVNALDDVAQFPWQNSVFEAAEVDLFASTHTCLPALRQLRLASGRPGGIVNNGAAGMPNFTGDLSGLCTRIATTPSPHPVLHEVRMAGAWVALLPVHFDTQRWQQEFLAQWPPGSPAWESYFQRICSGPAFSPAQALAGAGADAGADR